MREGVIRLRRGRSGERRPAHPWIYNNQILKNPQTIPAGGVVTVLDGAGKFIGRGYYNPRSVITARILTFLDEPLGTEFFRKRLSEAFNKRRPIFARTNACRAVFSEADSLAGLIADIYKDTLVLQISTLGMERFKEDIIEAARDALKPGFMYEKSDSPSRKLEGLKAARGWVGREGEPVVEILEGRARFLVDVENGHKTGFYLDQRRSRLAMEGVTKGKRALDLFSYTGGFAVSAAIHGANEVKAVDIKEDWLALGRKNAALNGVGDKTGFTRSDAFSFLEGLRRSGEKYDVVILDPPSFLKSKRSVKSASKGYKEINSLAMGALTDGGVLCTFSCSHNMPNDVFSGIIKESALAAKKRFSILKRCHQDIDHPIVKSIPETEYLKGYFLKIEDN